MKTKQNRGPVAPSRLKRTSGNDRIVAQVRRITGLPRYQVLDALRLPVSDRDVDLASWKQFRAQGKCRSQTRSRVNRVAEIEYLSRASFSGLRRLHASLTPDLRATKRVESQLKRIAKEAIGKCCRFKSIRSLWSKMGDVTATIDQMFVTAFIKFAKTHEQRVETFRLIRKRFGWDLVCDAVYRDMIDECDDLDELGAFYGDRSLDLRCRTYVRDRLNAVVLRRLEQEGERKRPDLCTALGLYARCGVDVDTMREADEKLVEVIRVVVRGEDDVTRLMAIYDQLEKSGRNHDLKLVLERAAEELNSKFYLNRSSAKTFGDSIRALRKELVWCGLMPKLARELARKIRRERAVKGRKRAK